ncbi:MAG: glycosyltransferase [Paludisphaera borealis]|uniref:glycosyltransferase n=1 Tax=Paludisphaera borealis TaxID=1387353 RepID=UPI00283DDDF2|nr:glycosyltransferase [Paludisphaera borealis]MDR3619016.1 glycosyltransferase [Paludisphaera borealis]
MDASSRGATPGARISEFTASASVTSEDLPPALQGLRVALVHDWLTGMRGGEKCLEVLCRAFPRATLYTLIHRKGSTSPAIESMAIRTSPLQGVPGVFRYYRHLLPLMPAAAGRWKLKNVDLVVSLSHCVAKSVQAPPGVPHVCYCFTPMRYAWQGREAYLESWSDRPIRRVMARSLLNRLRDWDRDTSKRVSDFVAISETIRDRIAGCYHRDSHVIPPPVDTDFYDPAPDATPREDFYLIVSALVPYKRVDQAIDACNRSGRRLVIIGAGPERARLEALAGPTVTFLGWQSDQAIRDHYRRCRALIFPGEEDFGIVPVEALACGAPVIALRRGGVAETVDDAFGRLYPEPTADALGAAVDGWEADGRPHDPALARRRAELYSLPVFRRRLLDLLADVASGNGRPSGIPRPHIAAQPAPRTHPRRVHG